MQLGSGSTWIQNAAERRLTDARKADPEEERSGDGFGFGNSELAFEGIKENVDLEGRI